MIRRHFLAGVVGLKAMCAAAALMVGVGQAEAATVLDVEFTITRAVNEYIPVPEEGPDEGFEDVPFEEFWGVKVGDTVNAVFTYAEEWVGNQKSLRASFSVADQLLFRGTLSRGMPWEMAWAGISDHTSSPEYFALEWDGVGMGTLEYTHDFRPWFPTVEATWSVVSPAPVPVPMTAALLPFGIGALAMMRKRRKQV